MNEDIEVLLETFPYAQTFVFSYDPYMRSDSKGIKSIAVVVLGDEMPYLRRLQWLQMDLRIPWTKSFIKNDTSFVPNKKKEYIYVPNIFSHGEVLHPNKSGVMEAVLSGQRLKPNELMVIHYDGKTNNISELFEIRNDVTSDRSQMSVSMESQAELIEIFNYVMDKKRGEAN